MKKITMKFNYDELNVVSHTINNELANPYDTKDLNTSLTTVLLWGVQRRIYQHLFMKKDEYSFTFSIEEGIAFFIRFNNLTPEDAYTMVTLEKIKMKIHPNLV